MSMRQPPPSLASYMQAISNGGSASSQPPVEPQPKAPENTGNKEALQNMIQNEMRKFKMFQEKKASLQHELTMVEQNLLKIQGSLEVFQAMGFIKLN
jgi:hypothetical protein